MISMPQISGRASVWMRFDFLVSPDSAEALLTAVSPPPGPSTDGPAAPAHDGGVGPGPGPAKPRRDQYLFSQRRENGKGNVIGI